MCTELSHCQYQIMCTRICIDSKTFWGMARSTLPISVPQYNMYRNPNMQNPWMQKSISQKNKLTSFNKFVEISYTMPSLSTTILSLLSVKFPRNNLSTQIKQQKRWPIYWTILLLTQTHKFSTGLVGCNYPYIPTRHTFQYLIPEAGPVGYIFSAKVHLTPSIQKILYPLSTESY